MIGLSIALVGTFLYSYFKFKEETVSNNSTVGKEQLIEKPVIILNGKDVLEYNYIKKNVSSISSFGNQAMDDSGNNSKLESPRNAFDNDDDDETSHHSFSSEGADEGRVEDFKRSNSPLETV